MAVRVAEGEEGDKEEGPEFDPRWPKAKGIVQQQIKPTIKDLEQAIKDKDKKLTEYLFERLMEITTLLARSFGMPELTSKLKTLEKKTFD